MIVNYFQAKYKKSIAVMHHTAGYHNPNYTIDGWMAKTDKIGTAYLIGGLGNNKNEKDWKDFDGKLVKYFIDDKMYGYHLGITEKSHWITKASIGIELCNIGGLVKNKQGLYINYVNKEVPSDQATGCVFRGYKYYESYTEAQIKTLIALLYEIANKHNIDIRTGLLPEIKKKGIKAFDFNQRALDGESGLWTHSNYRKDKIDCSPQSILLEAVLNL